MSRILTSCLVSHTPNTKNENTPVHVSFVSETAVLAAAVLQIIGIRVFLFGGLGGTQQYVTCLYVYEYSYLCLRC